MYTNAQLKLIAANHKRACLAAGMVAAMDLAPGQKYRAETGLVSFTVVRVHQARDRHYAVIEAVERTFSVPRADFFVLVA
jgi:hypothetical protein